MTEMKKDTCPDFASILKDTDPDDKILEQIIHCFYEQLKVFANWKCKSTHQAQDTLQDTMLTLMTSLSSYRGDAPLNSWLKKLVVSSCSRMKRGRKNNPNLHVEYDDFSTSSETVDQDMKLVISEQSDKLFKLLDTIDEPNRSLLLLHEGEDYSIQELAKRYELTSEAVKSRLKRTRAKMRETLLQAQA